MRLRECILSASGRTCVDTVDVVRLILPYVVGRLLETIARDVVSKLDETSDLEAHRIDFT